MKFIVYLLTLLFVGTAIAQNPTILQGNYITNVFGNSNFVLNPNAQTNTANVTNATRSTTTPLVATSEFTLSLASGANATWTLRAFDGGMKGQNCETRFTYRGFATATTKAEIVQNSLVVASLTLTPTTDPRIASINFPCGDLANLTTFRIAQTTANMTGTNEIGGIYVGLATNMANVAQAENVVQVGKSNAQSFTSGVEGTLLFDVETKDVYDEYDPATGIFTAKRAGDYLVTATLLSQYVSWTAGTYSQINISKNNGNTCREFKNVEATQTINVGNSMSCTITLSVGDTIRTKWQQNRGTTNLLAGIDYTFMSISRFPSSSELVVTPERQNVWGAVKYAGSSDFTGTSTSYTAVTDTSFGTKSLFGAAQAAGTACGLSSTDAGFCLKNVPPGSYQIVTNITGGPFPGAAGDTCAYIIEVSDGVTTQYAGDSFARTTNTAYGTYYNMGNGILKFDSFKSNVSVVLKYRLHSGTSQCIIRSQSSGSIQNPTITFKPLDQPSNSALYVQGPVKAAATGAAIPEGYVNEFSTRAITDTTIRTQTSPAASTWYYPWTGELTLSAGNWLICYSVSAESDQLGNTIYGSIETRIENKTDGTEIVKSVSTPTNGSTIKGTVAAHSACMPTAITTSKNFRVGLRYINWSGVPTMSSISLRCDQATCRLQAIRLN